MEVMTDTRASEISRDAAADIIKGISIPSCPSVVMSLLREARQPEVDFQNIVRLISGDVGLAASMLKAANSPFFGLRRKVQSVQQAVAVLGLKNILNLIMGLALRNALPHKDSISMERYWERSHLTAVVSSHLAGKLPDVSREDAYTFGLFRDCGIPILMQKFPNYKETLALANTTGSRITDLENERYFTTHVMVGSMMGRNWFLPASIVKAVRYHHDFEVLREPGDEVTVEICTMIAISFVAEHVVTKFLGFADDREWLVQSEDVMRFLGLDERELMELSADAVEELGELASCRR